MSEDSIFSCFRCGKKLKNGIEFWECGKCAKSGGMFSQSVKQENQFDFQNNAFSEGFERGARAEADAQGGIRAAEDAVAQEEGEKEEMRQRDQESRKEDTADPSGVDHYTTTYDEGYDLGDGEVPKGYEWSQEKGLKKKRFWEP
tara:strand:+ start:985 stop:1416 length:432 start_codon:yes stop_codon:yes gene_type:complete